MKLTILGNNGPYPKAGGACSGYLLETEDTKILIDCGNGVLSNLLKICSINDLDAIFLSHLHSDHIGDILIMKYAIGIGMIKGNIEKTVTLYSPMDDMEMVERFKYNNSFEILPIQEDQHILINNLEIEFKKMNHPVETYAIKVKNGDKVFVYSGDTAYNENLIDFSKEADLLLCEAGILQEDLNEDVPHLSPTLSGEIGKKANVKRLLLTHFWPEYDVDKIRIEGEESFGSTLELSEVMKKYSI